MTDNASFKRQVRDYAETHGLRYAEARTRLLTDAQHAEAQHAGRPVVTDADVRQVDGRHELGTVQQFMVDLRFEGGSVRYDVDESGFVDGQQSWNGSPWLLIGFEAAGAPERSIVLSRFEWLDDPQKAVGMLPVFSDFEGTWSSWMWPVVGVTPRTVRPSQDPTDVRLIVENEESGPVRMACADMLAMLPRDVLQRLADNGWTLTCDPENDDPNDDIGGILRPFIVLGGDRGRSVDEFVGKKFTATFDHSARGWFQSATRFLWSE